MGWTSTGGNLRGPAGPQGPQGQQGVQGPTGPGGADGTSVTIKGNVANASALPSSNNVKGDGWLTNDDGHLHVWGGSSFTDVGLIRGPQGPTGAQGPQGVQGNTGSTGPQGIQGVPGTAGARGSKWYTGTGAPGSIGGSLPGDYYLDLSDGTVYLLS